MTVKLNKDPWRGRHGPLLIAEIGGNHEGDFEAALKLTNLAIQSGADFVKFQLYRGDTLVNPLQSPNRHRHFRQFELSPEQHISLAERCQASGVGYLASVWDLEMLEWIDRYLLIYKIGSGDMTAYSIIKEFATRGKPIILSTGLSSLEEVVASVNYVQSINPAYNDPRMLALLQCTSMYPIKKAEANLRVIQRLRDATGLSVGYSDHTIGQQALFVAAAVGAQVLEFHFTDTRDGKSFRDHQVSLTCSDVQRLCDDLDELQTLLGDGIKRALPTEIETGHVTSFRRGIYCKRALKKGEIIKSTDLLVLRPNVGMDARQFDNVVGKKAARDLEPLESVSVEEET